MHPVNILAIGTLFRLQSTSCINQHNTPLQYNKSFVALLVQPKLRFLGNIVSLRVQGMLGSVLGYTTDIKNPPQNLRFKICLLRMK